MMKLGHMAKLITALLCSSVFVSACTQSDSKVKAVEVEQDSTIISENVPLNPEPNKPTKAETVVENNFGYEHPEELESYLLRSGFAIEDFPYIAIVKDIAITYPEWPFGDPVDPADGFVSGVRRYQVDLIQGLRGDLPQKFTYEIYGEAQEFLLNERPYPLAFCYSKDVKHYVAKEIEGRMLDDPRFLELFLDVWKKSDPAPFSDFKDKPCWFDDDSE